MMLLVYTFVFGMVMRVKWGVAGQDNIDFGLILFAGLLCHGLLAEVVMGAVGIIRGNGQYVKKVVFPLEVLNFVSIANGFLHMLLGLLIQMVLFVASGNPIYPTILLTPVVLAPFLIFLIGLSFFVAVLGVYVRDLSQFVGVLITVLLFLGPIVYPFTSVPVEIQPYVYWLNPLTIIVEQLRAVMLFGQYPNWADLGLYTIFACLMLVLGMWFFQRTRDGFADVI